MTNTTAWTVKFTDYIKFEGVKESIEATKKKAKFQKKEWANRTGEIVESSIQTIIEKGEIIKIDKLNPQYDMGFGADFKFSYKKDKNYSFFVDVTAKITDGMQFFGLSGDMVEDINSAFCYYTEEFKVYFSIKYNHYGFFFYEKPVISMVVRGFREAIDLDNIDQAHSINISNVLIALHEFLCDKGYGARASHYIQPNKRRFYNEFIKSQNK